MKEKSKPLYKKWWLWLIVIVVLLAFAIPETDEKVTEEKEPEKEPEELGEKPMEKVIEIDKTIELNGAEITLQSLRVKEDSTKLYGYWRHKTSYEKAHLDLLVTTTIKQKDKEIDILNRDRLLKQRKPMIDGSLNLELKRIDDTPIEITFTTNDDKKESESITVDIP